MRARSLAPAVLAAAVFTLAGCGTEGGGGTAGEEPAGKPTAAAPKTPAGSGDGGEESGAPEAAEVPEVLDFTAETVDGKPFDATTLAGKPTVLWFWAPWCPKCKAQAAGTAEVAADYEGKVNVVGVAGLDGNEAMRNFVSDTGTGSFPHLSDESGEVWKRFEVTEQSRYVVLDAQGETVFSGVLPGGEGLADKLDGLTG